jgi:protein BCP1
VKFDDDSIEFNLSELTNLIIEQPFIDSTIKSQNKEPKKEGEGDLYAFMTVINMNYYKDKQIIKQLRNYLLNKLDKSNSNIKLNEKEQIKNILNFNNQEKKHLGLLLNERFVNMPPNIVPPLLNLLFEELEWVIKDVSYINNY